MAASGGDRQWTPNLGPDVKERATSGEAIEALRALYTEQAQALHTAHHALKIAERALWEAWKSKMPSGEDPTYLEGRRQAWHATATDLQQRVYPDVLQDYNEAMMVLLQLDELEWKLATAEGRTTLDYKTWRKQAEPSAEPPAPVNPAPNEHWFADGDRITIHCRKADGTTFTIHEEFKGLFNKDGQTYLEYYVWRPDGSTYWVPIEEVVGIELRDLPQDE